MGVRSIAGRLALTGVLVATVALTGCAGRQWQRTDSVVRQADLTVELEQLWFEGAPVERFQHPAEIELEPLVAALRSLQYETEFLLRGTKRTSVVGDLTARPLAYGIIAGLEKASASERVRFRLRTGSTSLFVLPSSTLTKGVAFVDEDGRLEVAFDQLHALPDIDETGASSDRWGDPTGRPRSRGRLVYPEFARAGVNEQGGVMPLWASIDLAAVAASGEDGDATAATAHAGAGNAESESAEIAEASPGEAPDPAPATPVTDAEVLAQLRLLEKLRDDGAITAEEHDRRRKQILNDAQKNDP